MADLLAVAEACEAAPRASKALNRDIARAVGWGYQTPSEGRRKHPSWFHPDDCRNGSPVLDSLHGTDVWREPSDYAGSVDAAMSLLPDGMKLVLDTHHMIATVYEYWPITSPEDQGFASYQAEAATPALAIVAAALRARHSDGEPAHV